MNAEIYETKETEGNTVFTDTPSASAEKRHEVDDAEAIREVGDVEGAREGAQEKQVEGARGAVHPHVGHHR